LRRDSRPNPDAEGPRAVGTKIEFTAERAEIAEGEGNAALEVPTSFLRDLRVLRGGSS